MSNTLLLVPLLPVWIAAVITAIVLLVLLMRSARSAPAGSSEEPAETTEARPAEPQAVARAAATQARRHGGLTAALAVTAPIAIAPVVTALVAVLARLTLPVGLVLVAIVPAALAATFFVVHALGEHHRPRLRGAVRTASLAPLSPVDITPRRLRLWLSTLLGLTTLAIALAIALPAAIIVPVASDSTQATSAEQTYAALLALAVGTVLAGHRVVRVIAERPAIPGVDTAWDADLRRLSAHRILRGAQFFVGLTGTVSLLGSAVAGAQVFAAPGVLLLVVVSVVALVPGPVPRDAAPPSATEPVHAPAATATAEKP